MARFEFSLFVFDSSQRGLRRTGTLNRRRCRRSLFIEDGSFSFGFDTRRCKPSGDLFERIRNCQTLFVYGKLIRIGVIDPSLDLKTLGPCLLDLVDNDPAMPFGPVDLLSGRTLLYFQAMQSAFDLDYQRLQIDNMLLFFGKVLPSIFDHA